MVETVQIDQLDKKILASLQEDGRKSILEIAKDLDVTRATVHARIAKLKESGVILGSKVVIDYRALGFGVSAYVGIRLSDKARNVAVRDALMSIPGVVEIHAITGSYNMFAKVTVKDVSALHDLLTNEMKISGVSSTETFLVLETYLNKDVGI
jgi:Lrp/AsnC family transcriptional regulator, regulator for asnA, asnC and gidA